MLRGRVDSNRDPQSMCANSFVGLFFTCVGPLFYVLLESRKKIEHGCGMVLAGCPSLRVMFQLFGISSCFRVVRGVDVCFCVGRVNQN